MSILTKTQVKNIFVTNAVPQQVDYSNWIDSCVFLNADGTVSLNSLVMPYEASPPLPAAGFAALFFNASDSNYLSVQNSAGNVSRVTPNKYLNLPVNQLMPLANGTILALLARDITIVSIKMTVSGAGTFTLNVTQEAGSGAGGISIISPIAVVPTGIPSIINFTITNIIVSANQKLVSYITNIVSTFNGVLTIEYKEN